MITRDDVAKLAGVSKSTVSRVLNNNGYVSPENREKIEAAIKNLGYTPNLIARGLKTRKSGQVLFCASEFTNPFYTEVYKGMEEYAQMYGYTIIVSSDFNISTISQRMLDGVVLSSLDSITEEELLSLDIPAVLTNYTSQAYRLPHIKIDIKNGAKDALSFLYKHGHKDIAFFTNVQTENEQRFNAYKTFMEENHIGFNPDLIFKSFRQTSAYEQGYEACIEFMRKGVPATAIFAFNDAMAIGALSAMSEYDITAPDKISIIGFDDIIQSRFTTPALTTVQIPKYTLGAESVRMLIQKINGENISSIVLATELIERKSVKSLNP